MPINGFFSASAEGLAADRKECERLGQPVPYRLFRFDAFKYAKKPFLRQFIRELAEELPPSRARYYKERLYLEKTRLSPRLSRRWWAPTVLLASLGLITLGLLLLVSSDPSGFLHDVAKAAVIILFSSSLLAFVVNLGVPLLTVNSKAPVPDSEEQFEEIFREVLDERLADEEWNGTYEANLVVFVDELDRCSPAEVATTLETLRTFLGVSRCVFIVAADQQVLEQALTKHVRQATPPDPANPYYSAGSAYLDKIFGYQLALPPFRVRRLVNFALELVATRQGVWQEVDLGEVIPILLPTHVHSPRRVKVLLNAFALTYSLARERAHRKEIGEVRERAPEIAKLVCLRVEFPLFARDLNLDDRLSAAVLAAATAIENNEAPADAVPVKDLPIEIRRRAVAFARGDLAAAHLFAESDARAELDQTLLDFDNDKAEKAAREAADRPDGEEGARPAPVRHSQALQLIRYLEKSVEVKGPYSDLIHLEAAGATFDLDPQIAQQLERDALDRRQKPLLAALRELAPEERISALRMLGQLTHESHGPDGRNTMHSLLQCVARADVQLEAVAPSLANDLEVFDRRNSFDVDDLPGAFSIALVAKRFRLAGRLLETENAESNEEFRATVLRLADYLETSAHPRLVEIGAAALLESGEETAELIGNHRKKLRTNIADGVLEKVLAQVERDVRESEAEGAAPEVAEEHRTRAQAAIDQITAASRMFLNTDRQLAEQFLTPLFSMPNSLVERQITECLEAFPPLRSSPAASALLAYARSVSLERVPKLLQHVDPGARGAIRKEADPLLDHVWSQTVDGEIDLPQSFEKVVRKLYGKSRHTPAGPATERVSAALAQRIETAVDASELDRRLALAKRLAEAGLLGFDRVAAGVADGLAKTIEAAVPDEHQPALRGRIDDWLGFALSHSADINRARVLRALQSSGCWIESPLRQQLMLEVASAMEKEVSSPLSTDQVVDLVDDYGRAAAAAAAIWISKFSPKPDGVVKVVAPYASMPPQEIAAALRTYTRYRGGAVRAQVAEPLIVQAARLRTSPDTLKAARADAADEPPLVAALVELADGANNSGDRAIVFDLWQAVQLKEVASWQTMIAKVMLPMASKNPTAFDLVRSRLGLIGPAPSEVHETIVEGLRAAVPEKPGRGSKKARRDGKRAKSLERALGDAGLIEKKGRRIGPIRFG
jgi:hypothetical protein